MENIIRKTKIVLLIILMGILGFIREVIFENTNFKMWNISNPNFFSNSNFQFFNDFLDHSSYHQLTIFKWGMTAIYFILFLGLTDLAIQWIYSTKKYRKLVVITFMSIFVVAAFSYVIGMLLDDVAKGYKYARILMGAAQSPFLLFILIPAIKLTKLKA